MAISKDSLKSYELPKEAEIRQSALSVQEMLTARSTANAGNRRSNVSSESSKPKPSSLPPPKPEPNLAAPVAASLATNGWSSSPTARCNTSRLRCCRNQKSEGRTRSRGQRSEVERSQSAIRNPQSAILRAANRQSRNCQLPSARRWRFNARTDWPSARAQNAGGDRRPGL